MSRPPSATPSRSRPFVRALRLEVLGVTEPGIDREALFPAFAGETRGGLVLLEAPAGFGKTHALVQWCERALRAHYTAAWIGLRPALKHTAALANRIVAALDECGVEALPAPPASETRDSDFDLFQFAIDLGRSISNHRRPALLVLDDYQVIEGSPADELLTQLFERLPANLWIGLSSRRTCPISLSRILLQGRLHRLGWRSLLFSKAEAREFFGGSLGASQLKSVYSLTEGWPAALKMAQMCLPEWQKKDGELTRVPQFTRVIGEYCSREVLRYAGPESVDFLADCSVVETLDPGLCDTIRCTTDSAQILSDLAAHETFMEGVDAAANSWRVPKLLRETLGRRSVKRGPEWLATAHLRAAEHYEAKGSTREALEHYLAAGNPAMAAAALERTTPLIGILTLGDVGEQELLDLIPSAQLRDFPRLSLFHAFLINKRGLPDEARTVLEEVASRTNDFTRDRPGGNDSQLENESLCLHLYFELTRHARVTLQYLRAIEEQLPKVSKVDGRLAVFLHISLGVLYELRGELHAAESHFIQCQQLSVAERAPWLALWLKYHSGSLALVRGQLMEARYQLQTALKLSRSDAGSYPAFRGLAKIELAEIDYETDSLHEAQIKLGEGLYTAEHVEGWFEPHATLYETAMMLHWHAGRVDQIEPLLARGAALQRVGLTLGRFLNVLRLRFELLQGRTDAAQSIVDSYRFDHLWMQPTFQDEFAYREWDLIGLCLCHLAIHRRDFQRATQIVDRLEQIARMNGRGRTVARALILRAVIARQDADEEQAIAHMLRALQLSEPQGYRRVFLDEGVLARPILEAVKRRAIEEVPAHLGSYARSLCNELAKKDKPAVTDRSAGLSEREHDILRELGAGQSNKLIARKLGLAAPTIKFHLNNVFRKLGVRKRAAAVAEAHRRSWLP